MKISQLWSSVRARPDPDQPAETIEAGEPETGVLSLQQLTESLGSSSSAFDPDSTAYFSASELLLRRAQLTEAMPKAEPETGTGSAEGALRTVPDSSAEAHAPDPRGRSRLSPVTRLALLLLLPALAMLLLPHWSHERAEQALGSPDSARPSPAPPRSASAAPAVPVSAARAPEPEQQLLGEGVTLERAAADHLAAGDFERALQDYTALAGRSPAHAAAVRILQRRLKTERETSP